MLRIMHGMNNIEFEFSRQIFEIFSNIKFNENISSCSRVFPRTDMTKLIVAFRNFSKAPKTASSVKTCVQKWFQME
jgi:hypothetical protein